MFLPITCDPVQLSFWRGPGWSKKKKRMVSSVEANHIFYITRPEAGCTCCSDTGATRQHGHIPVYVVRYQVPRSLSSPRLSAATSPTATCPQLVGLWLAGFIAGPVLVFIRCNISRVKCLEAALHSRLPASWNDPGFSCGFPADFLLSLSGLGGLRGPVWEAHILCPRIPCFPPGQLQWSLTTGHPLKPPQTSGISWPVQACSAPGFVAFPEHFCRAPAGGMSCVPPWSCLCLMRSV